VDPIPPPATSSGLGRLVRLARKELTEILRDRRTILTLLVMPLLLYPLLTIGFGLYRKEDKTIYRFGFPSKQAEESLKIYLVRHSESRGAEPGPPPELQGGVFADVEEAVRSGQIDVGFRSRSPEAPDRGSDWDLVYLSDSPRALKAIRYVNQTATAVELDSLRVLVKERFHQQPPRPLSFQPVPVVVETRPHSPLIVFVPLVLILMTMTGAVYPAIDLTAGERERGTLEVLLAAPVPRVSLLFGKYIAVLTVSVLTALMNLGSMTLSLWVSSRLFGGFAEHAFGPGGIQPLALLAVFALVLLFAAFFSAVLLVLSSFARSFKEAQAYLIPLMVVSLVPGVLGLLPDLRLTGVLTVVPLLNIVLLARDLLEGNADPVSAGVVVIATAAYTVLAVSVAARVFGAEGVLYSESGGWRSRRRRS
jgi:ABC-2 type transport system permease protein/sodium transport system permease protein